MTMAVMRNMLPHCLAKSPDFAIGEDRKRRMVLSEVRRLRLARKKYFVKFLLLAVT
jgi:hypothetical protein